MKSFYEKNTELLDSELNHKFEDILWMTKDEFRQWCIDLRKLVVYLWDEKGIPPRVGYSEDEMVAQFDKMMSFPVHQFETVDLLTGENNVIRNTSNLGNAANQFFPTMMKTRINYTTKDDGKSIYDFFARDELLDTFITYASRHFKRDSFYHYSRPVQKFNKNDFKYHTDDAVDWIKWFELKERHYNRSDYWLVPKRLDSSYTGYNEDLQNQEYLFLKKEDVGALNIPDKCKTNVDYLPDCDGYQIRYFEYDQKLFPIGLKAFRVSFCQYAVNYPPLTAKYLYERFTEHIKDQDQINIYDPSAGWGGRIIGAMSVKDDRNIHYIGTDPNEDHTLPDGRTKYEDLAEFYNTRTSRGCNLFPHTHSFSVFQEGSECIGSNPRFREFKGRIDLVFTSPPYFAKEGYSEDETQSYKKFSEYKDWVDGFLRPTLQTAVDWLRNDRYLLWNIANCKFGKDILPLETDSRRILEELGMEYVMTLKMSLAQMPGGNRIDKETGLPKTESFVKVRSADGKKDMFLKYEPVFVYYKA